MTIVDFYSNDEIAALLAENVGDSGVKELLRKGQDDLRAKECLVSVLGTQGSGKSSLLNALVFGNVVLPVDVDETTCIPTVVRYSDSAEPKAVAVFEDGKTVPVECSEERLAEYVHQAKNPGNTKKIKYLEIRVKHELLQSGVCLVDLPGVGSVTAANQLTTEDYLKQSTAAMFMLRSVPPITASESAFIQGALPLMGQVLWIQNQWKDESKDEVEDGRDGNHQRIKAIVKRIHFPAEAAQPPLVVCVKRALDGKILDDVTAIEASGVLALERILKEFGDGWYQKIVDLKVDQAKCLVDVALHGCDDRLQNLDGEVESEMAKIKSEKRRMQERQAQNKDLVRRAEELVANRRKDLNEIISKACQRSAENLRNKVRMAIDSGITGGSALDRSFSDHQKAENGDLFKTVQGHLMDLFVDVEQFLEKLQECRVGAVNVNVATNFEKRTRAHDYYARVGGASLGLGGAAYGAYLGTLVAPGIGTAIGGVVGGILGGLGGWFGGSKLSEVHVKSQSDEARRELFAYIEKYQSEAEADYKKALKTYVTSLQQAADDWLKAQDKRIQDNYKRKENDILKPADEKRALIEKVKGDRQKLVAVQKNLEDLK